MTRGRSLRGMLTDWPFAFAGGVALWFVVAAVGASGFHLDRSDDSTSSDASSSSIDTSATTEPTGVTAGSVEVRVKSFRLDQGRNGLQAEFTLEVHDLEKSNVDFAPAQLTLRRLDDGTVTAAKEDIVMGVSPKLPLIAPVTFDITALPGADYRLSYAGKTLFTGRPF